MPVVLFPLVLLSMLEANSPFVPLSKAVCRSLVRNWRAWIGFYLETILLLAVTGGIVIAALRAGEPSVGHPTGGPDDGGIADDLLPPAGAVGVVLFCAVIERCHTVR